MGSTSSFWDYRRQVLRIGAPNPSPAQVATSLAAAPPRFRVERIRQIQHCNTESRMVVTRVLAESIGSTAIAFAPVLSVNFGDDERAVALILAAGLRLRLEVAATHQAVHGFASANIMSRPLSAALP